MRSTDEDARYLRSFAEVDRRFQSCCHDRRRRLTSTRSTRRVRDKINGTHADSKSPTVCGDSEMRRSGETEARASHCSIRRAPSDQTPEEFSRIKKPPALTLFPRTEFLKCSFNERQICRASMAFKACAQLPVNCKGWRSARPTRPAASRLWARSARSTTWCSRWRSRNICNSAGTRA